MSLRTGGFLLLPVAPFANLVSVVVLVSSQPKVIGIHAGWIVTTMQAINSGRNWAIEASPDKAVSLPELSAMTE